MRDVISSSEYPNFESISSVCSPSFGAGLDISLGVFSNRAAGLA